MDDQGRRTDRQVETWLETIRDAYNVLNNVRNIIRILTTSEAQENPTLAYEERMIETRRKRVRMRKKWPVQTMRRIIFPHLSIARVLHEEPSSDTSMLLLLLGQKKKKWTKWKRTDKNEQVPAN